MEIEKIVPEYHSKNFIVRKIFYARLQVALRIGKSVLSRDGARVLDLGCGEGALLNMIEKDYTAVDSFGVDIEPDIEKLKQRLKAKIVVADVNNLPFSDNYFDAVFSLDVLEHIEDLSRPVKEIGRVLKDDGILIISEPTESAIYKFGRWMLKGTFSAVEGPAASPHWHNAEFIEDFMPKNGFELVQKQRIPDLPMFDLFHIMGFKKRRAI